MKNAKEVLVETLIRLMILLGIVAIAGCQGNFTEKEVPPDIISNPDTSPPPTTQPGAPTQENATPDILNQSPTKLPERVPLTEPLPSITGEVPTPLLDNILKDLVERTGAAPADVILIQAQAVIWNDGSLGCPQPGIFYTQALVKGYWVVFEINGQKYNYRASGSGYFFLCENESPPISPPGTPDS
jgi:hypothetical protein